MATIPTVPNVPTVGNAPTAGSPTPAPAQGQKVNSGIDPKLAFSKQQSVFRRIYYPTIRSGALLTFQYLFYKHDPYPLVLCTGKWADGKVAGVNLHYLTFRYMTYLLNQFCGKSFNYQSVKSDKFIRNSFRSYKREGIRNVKLLDCDFLNTMLKQVRSYNPTEIEAMRQYVRKQLEQKLGTTADELTGTIANQLPGMLKPGQQSGRSTQSDGRNNPNL